MNNPDSLPVDVAEQRDWLNEHKGSTGASWTMLAQQTGIAAGTLSPFALGQYQGNNERIAREIFRFRQLLITQAEIAVEAPTVPSFFETTTSRRLQSMLTWAQRGRMVLAAMGPGTGKTKSSENYRDGVSNVWLVTMRPSTAGVNNMLIATLAAMGDKGARGSSQALSDRVVDRVKGSGGLIIFDEAQHSSERSIEEIRSWHDATGIGIALFGNETVLARIEGGSRRAAFAQLYSRIGMRHAQNLPLPDDARAMAKAWEIEEPRLVKFIVERSQLPGGLRTVTMMIELATMLANVKRAALELGHLQEAWAQLVSRPVVR